MNYDLGKSWQNLVAAVGIDFAAGEPVFQLLHAAYASRERAYHNLTHLGEVLAWIDDLQKFAVDISAVRMAAWFHDAVYQAGLSDNEEKSAALVGTMLTPLGVTSDFIDRVAGMVLATKNHTAPGVDLDTRILLDADLAILGAHPARYSEYAAAIRKEYTYAPDALYQMGRRQILIGFLTSPRIFGHDIMFARLEAIARSNIQAELWRLV